MRWTGAVRQAASAAANDKKNRNLKSLALSVYFKQPDFGMKDYEILSRATAFLVGVDPPFPSTDTDSPYGHLEAAARLREKKTNRGKYSQAEGDGRRKMMDLGWLEFVPREVRPQVHICCSSHVVSPFLWKDYYPQPWLTQVRAEHCAYSLEVFETPEDSDADGKYDADAAPTEALAKIALNPEAFHHPEGRDIALVHFKEEASSLKLLRNLGVDVLHLRDPEKLYEKGEEMLFDGFVVSEQNAADNMEHYSERKKPSEERKDSGNDEDVRIFYPYKEKGALAFHTNDRFFATTPVPLPEGLCGAPALDIEGNACGMVEGIVPENHKDKRLAGAAAFMPSYVVKEFIDYVERGLVETMMPKDLFQMVVTAKKTNAIGGGVFEADGKGTFSKESNWEEAANKALGILKKRYSAEEYDAIVKTTEREGKEVLEILEKEGGEIDDIIQRVRQKTLQMQAMIQDQYRKQQQQQQNVEGGNTEGKAGG